MLLHVNKKVLEAAAIQKICYVPKISEKTTKKVLMLPKSMKNRLFPVNAAKPILNTGLEGE